MVRRGPKDSLLPNLLPWARTASTRSGFSKPYPSPRDGACAVSLGSTFQCISSLIVKIFFLISRLNLLSFSLQSLPLSLSLHVLVKIHSPAFLQALFRYWKTSVRSSWSLLLSRLNIPNSLSTSLQERCSDDHCGPPLDQLHEVLILRDSDLDAVHQVSWVHSRRGTITSLGLPAVLVWMQPRIWLTSWNASALTAYVELPQ